MVQISTTRYPESDISEFLSNSPSGGKLKHWNWDIKYEDTNQTFSEKLSNIVNKESSDGKIKIFIPKRDTVHTSLLFRNPRAFQIPLILNEESVSFSARITQHPKHDLSDFFCGTSISVLSSALDFKNFQKIEILLKDGFSITNGNEVITLKSDQNCFLHNVYPPGYLVPNLPSFQNWIYDVPQLFKFKYIPVIRKLNVSHGTKNLGMFALNPTGKIGYLTVISDAASLTVSIKHKFTSLQKLSDICSAKTAYAITKPEKFDSLPIPKIIQNQVKNTYDCILTRSIIDDMEDCKIN